MRKQLFVGALVVVLVGAALTISFAGTRAVTRPISFKVFERARHGQGDQHRPARAIRRATS